MITLQRRPSFRIPVLLIAAVLVALAAQSHTRAQLAFLPADTEMVIRTTELIDASAADQTHEYTALLDEPLVVNGTLLATKGADAVLQVVDANTARGVRGRASLSLQLTAVMIEGRRVPISTASVKSEGGSQTGRAAKAGIGGAAVGAVIGGLLGGKAGAAKGAAIGGGAGVGVVAVTGQRIQVPAETRLTFVLAEQAPLANE
jgi:hypothetical protein